jgi:hypothetical protein
MGKPLSEVLSPSILHPLSTGDGWKRKGLKFIAIFAGAALAAGVAFAQADPVQSMAERSSIIVRGKVLKTGASDEPLLAPSGRTAIIAIEQMYAGKEIAGDQARRTATVILSKPESVKVGEEAFFFGNPRFLGKSITIADEGEVPATAGASLQNTVEQAVQARRSKPVLDRMATASLIFRGSVTAVQPLEGAAQEPDKRGARPSEHDPEWQVATVQIVRPLRGDAAAGQTVTVVFSASKDIVWFHAPKLKPGQDAVFLAQSPRKDEEGFDRGSQLEELARKQSIYLVTAPFDVLPATDEDRVRGLLAAPKETK